MNEKLKLIIQQTLVFVVITLIILLAAAFFKGTDIAFIDYATKNSYTLFPELATWLRNASANTIYLSVILISVFIFSTVGIWLIVPLFTVSEDKALIVKNIEAISNGELHKLSDEVKQAVKRLIKNKGLV